MCDRDEVPEIRIARDSGTCIGWILSEIRRPNAQAGDSGNASRAEDQDMRARCGRRQICSRYSALPTIPSHRKSFFCDSVPGTNFFFFSMCQFFPEQHRIFSGLFVAFPFTSAITPSKSVIFSF
jgi:hypothetical protein